MKYTIAGLLGVACALASQTAAAAPTEAEPYAIFKCDRGRELAIQFVIRDAVFVAVVNSGGSEHALPIQETVDLSDPQIVWSDGVRTLTWTAGVRLMWMDGGSSDHLMCGRAEHEHRH